MKKLIGLLVVFAVAATMAYAATVNADGQAKAKIIQAPTLTHVDDAALDYGVVIRNSGGSVVIPAVASPTATYNTVAPATGAISADHFTLTGLDTVTTYSVSIPASVTLNGPNSATMSSTLVLSENPATVSGVETKDLYVGGTLTVGSSQELGSYIGTYNMVVTY